MTESSDAKVCPMCAETIKAAAKVCPHCRYWQSRFSLQNPQVVAAVCLVLALAAIIGLGAFVEWLFGSKRDFAEYRNEIARMQGGKSGLAGLVHVGA